MPMRNFPRPVAQFDTLPGRPERLDLAVVSGSGGTNIVAVRRQQRQRRRLGVAVRTPRPVRPGPGPLLRHLPAPPRPLRLRRPHLGGRGATGGPLRVADWQASSISPILPKHNAWLFVLLELFFRIYFKHGQIECFYEILNIS
jgi:hypothetical protein